MEFITLLEPTVDLARLAEVLDGLGHEGRVHTTRTWTKAHKRAIFEAAKGFRPLDLDFLVPSSIGAATEVIHEGHNTLPLFTHFQKRFAKAEGVTDAVGGYNHQVMQGLTGPGYFMARKGEGEHEGELVIDYTRVPTSKPEGWPPIRDNESGIAGMVSGGLTDYVRGISNHVSIGVAFRRGQPLGQYFTLVRKDAD